MNINASVTLQKGATMKKNSLHPSLYWNSVGGKSIRIQWHVPGWRRNIYARGIVHVDFRIIGPGDHARELGLL
jgi:hypothetical protein